MIIYSKEAKYLNGLKANRFLCSPQPTTFGSTFSEFLKNLTTLFNKSLLLYRLVSAGIGNAECQRAPLKLPQWLVSEKN